MGSTKLIESMFKVLIPVVRDLGRGVFIFCCDLSLSILDSRIRYALESSIVIGLKSIGVTVEMVSRVSALQRCLKRLENSDHAQ